MSQYPSSPKRGSLFLLVLSTIAGTLFLAGAIVNQNPLSLLCSVIWYCNTFREYRLLDRVLKAQALPPEESDPDPYRDQLIGREIQAEQERSRIHRQEGGPRGRN